MDQTQEPKKSHVVLTIGRILTLVAVGGFLTLLTVSLAIYGEVYLYDGYSFTAVLCTIMLVLAVSGIAMIVVGSILKKKRDPGGPLFNAFSIVLIALALTVAAVLAVSAIQTASARSTSSELDRINRQLNEINDARRDAYDRLNELYRYRDRYK